MQDNKIAEFIKKLRKENNLTQNDLANKYNVTFQAVSKWETGKSLPDIELLKKMANDYNASLDDILDGNYNKKKSYNIIIIIVLVIILAALGILLLLKDEDFRFKTISSNCASFTISGSLSYNKNKSAIFINNINYCSGDDTNVYKEIKCSLYEQEGTSIKLIEEISDTNTNLEDFLKNVSFTIPNYNTMCRDFKDNILYLEIEATKDNNELVLYKVPLLLKDDCTNKLN